LNCCAALVHEVHPLTLQNDRTEVVRLAAWLDSAIAQLGLTADTAHALHLCLEEAVLNVVLHAFEPDTSHEIRVALWRDEAAVHAELTDNGRPFDPISYELQPPPKNLQSAAIGGLGIKLMRSFAARIVYQRSEATNRLLLSFPP
jgi:sigma-B regulation protein RsbU (phosphoserine phosphatase)